MSEKPPGPDEQPEVRLTPLPGDSKVIDSHELFEGRHEVLIVHAHEVYRLRVTRKGRLILQK